MDFGDMFKSMILKSIMQNGYLGTRCETTLR